MAYRNTPQQTTGRTPSDLMMGRTARTRLDLLKPSLQENVRQKQFEQVSRFGGQERSLEEGDRVLARDYRGGSRWLEGEVIEKQGDKHYIIKVRRHVDQLAPLGPVPVGSGQRIDSTPAPPGPSSSVETPDPETDKDLDPVACSPAVTPEHSPATKGASVGASSTVRAADQQGATTPQLRRSVRASRGKAPERLDL